MSRSWRDRFTSNHEKGVRSHFRESNETIILTTPFGEVKMAMVRPNTKTPFASIHKSEDQEGLVCGTDYKSIIDNINSGDRGNQIIEKFLAEDPSEMTDKERAGCALLYGIMVSEEIRKTGSRAIIMQYFDDVLSGEFDLSVETLNEYFEFSKVKIGADSGRKQVGRVVNLVLNKIMEEKTMDISEDAAESTTETKAMDISEDDKAKTKKQLFEERVATRCYNNFSQDDLLSNASSTEAAGFKGQSRIFYDEDISQKFIKMFANDEVYGDLADAIQKAFDADALNRKNSVKKNRSENCLQNSGNIMSWHDRVSDSVESSRKRPIDAEEDGSRKRLRPRGDDKGR